MPCHRRATNPQANPSTRKPGKTGPASSRLLTQGLARELHQSNSGEQEETNRLWLENTRPSGLVRGSWWVPIAAEPVRRFGLGHAPGATPARDHQCSNHLVTGRTRTSLDQSRLGLFVTRPEQERRNHRANWPL